ADGIRAFPVTGVQTCALPILTTYLLPGLADTLKAAALSMISALPLGAVLGIARMSDHRWVRAPAAVIVEFFRAIPVLLLMLFAQVGRASCRKWGYRSGGVHCG